MNTLASNQRVEENWFERTLTALRDSGPTGKASAEYIRQRRIPLGFSTQKHTGASWFDWRRLRYGLFLNADYAGEQPDAPWLYALLAHEAKHLEQGLAEALSVRGELVAWQLQYDILTDGLAQIQEQLSEKEATGATSEATAGGSPDDPHSLRPSEFEDLGRDFALGSGS